MSIIQGKTALWSHSGSSVFSRGSLLDLGVGERAAAGNDEPSSIISVFSRLD